MPAIFSEPPRLRSVRYHRPERATEIADRGPDPRAPGGTLRGRISSGNVA